MAINDEKYNYGPGDSPYAPGTLPRYVAGPALPAGYQKPTQGRVLGLNTTVTRYTPPKPPTPPAPASDVPSIQDKIAMAAMPTFDPATKPEAPAMPVAPQEPSEIDKYYENLDRDFGVEDEARIREEARKAMQMWIDAVNAEYTGLISREEQAGQSRLGQTRAINARSGLIGSDFGEANTAETQKYNSEVIKQLERERSTKLAEINSKIDARARDEIAAKKAEAMGNAEKYVQRLALNQEAARSDLKDIAKSGGDLDDKTKSVLLKQTGYDPLTFEMIFNANKPAPEYRAPVQLKDGTVIITDKAGNIKNLGKYDLPDNHQFLFAPDGTPMVFDKDSGTVGIAEGFYKGQFKKPTTPKTTTQPASVKEYEYAKANGYAGSFTDYKKEVANYSDIDAGGDDEDSDPFEDED